MQITEDEWINYKDRMAALSDKAAENLEMWLQVKGGYQNVSRERLIQYMYGLATYYGEATASLAAEMYDEVAALSGVTVPSAEVAETASYGEIASAVKAVTRNTTTNSNLGNVVVRYVKRAAEDTTLKNVKRDQKKGAQFAWVPAGDTCAFCLMLASNGWQNQSEKAMRNGHASHIHPNCDCTYAVRFDGKSNVKGYNPDKYKAMYDNAEGRTWNDKLNSMRRIQYQENKDVINAQKRANYEKHVVANEKSRKLHYGKEKSFSRIGQMVNAKQVTNFSANNIYLANDVQLSTREVRWINNNVSEAKRIMGISEKCNIPIVIVNDNDILASYNPVTDVMYVSSNLSSDRKILELQQGFAASDNTSSTAVHEFIHWKDADDYRKSGKIIESADVKSEYSIYQKDRAEKELIKLGYDPKDVDRIRKEIGQYAADSLLDNDFEEVYTELRTKRKLG